MLRPWVTTSLALVLLIPQARRLWLLWCCEDREKGWEGENHPSLLWSMLSCNLMAEVLLGMMVERSSVRREGLCHLREERQGRIVGGVLCGI